MGVKNLNNIVRRIPETNKRTFPTIIIDGTNMLITYLSRCHSNMEINFNKTEFNTVNLNLIKQMRYIIDETSRSLVSSISNFKQRYGAEKILFVMDPNKQVEYKINENMQFNEKYRALLLPPADDNEAEKIYRIKDAEKEARKNSNSKKAYVSDIYMKILQDRPQIYAEKFRQSFHFSENSNLFKLIHICLHNAANELYRRFPGLFYIVNAEDEADLVIKNIGETESEKNDVLICSTDTDYFVLFSNNPRVFVTSLKAMDEIYSPLIQWRAAFNHNGVQIIPDNEINFYAFRLSALFGNDYTRETLITAKEYENCLKIFAPNLFEVKTRRSNINKIILNEKSFYSSYYERQNNGDELMPFFEYFDEIIENYTAKNNNHLWFFNYLLTVTIYTNFRFFDRYKIENNEYDISAIIASFISNLYIKDPNNAENLEYCLKYSKYKALLNWYKTTQEPEENFEFMDPETALDMFKNVNFSKNNTLLNLMENFL